MASDVLTILNGLKNKTLDAVNFNLLKHAYELQQQNLEQVKDNNELHKDRAALLAERKAELEAKVAELELQLGDLRRQLPQSDGEPKVTDLEAKALYLFRDAGSPTRRRDDLLRGLPSAKLKSLDVIAELCKKKLIRLSQTTAEDGAIYSLTDAGRKWILAQE